MLTQSARDYFKGKNVIVTGGATGIGREIAVNLFHAGANLLLIGRRQELLEATKQELLSRQHDQRVEILACDISDRPLLEQRLPDVLKTFVPDVLINNAGVPCSQKFLDVSADEFERVIAINFIGTVNVTRITLPFLLKKKAGHVGFVSSVAGLVGIVGYTAYSASKFAMGGFAEALRNEFRDRGISVSVLFPPDVQTPLLEAESTTMPLETKALNNTTPLSAGLVAQVFLNQMACKRFAIFPTLQTKFLAWLLRHLPGLVIWFNDRAVRLARG